MISSIIDNDFYKFTMQNAVVKLFPRAKAKYKFINRGNNKFPDGFDKELRKLVNEMAFLKLNADEENFIKEKCYYLDPTYIDFLKGYRYNPKEVTIKQKNGVLDVAIKGYWYRTILWEVPLLALISELYFKKTNPKTYSKEKIAEIARNKAIKYQKLNAKVADFGTRRRFSFFNHDLIIKTLSEFSSIVFTGTSNLFLAKKYNVSPIGTHAHEWFMFHSAKYGYKLANKLALENWVKVYRGDLGIALSDTFTSEIFFKAFDTKFAKLFDGVRHDSGDPLIFTNKTIEHYKKLNIDPLSKTIIFSDSLNPDMVEKISNYCSGKIKISFGIGTNFTNDVGVKPLNIVIKMSEAKPEGQEWIQTVKLSDTHGKYTGDKKMIGLCKEVLNI